MKMLETKPRSVLCAYADSPFFYFGWPSIARLQDGTLAMASSGYRLEHICPFGKAVISYSKDEGKTWTCPAPVIDTPMDDRDAGIVPFGNGRAIFTSFNNTTKFQRKVNKGRHFSEDPVTRAKADLIDAYLNYVEAMGEPDKYVGSTYRLSEDGGYTFGEIKFCPVTTPHGPCVLKDGSLLYIGRRFDGNNEYDDGAVPYIQCYTMKADGSEFEHLSSIENVVVGDAHPISCEPHCIQLPSGRIICHIRIQTRGKASTDGGANLFTVYQSISDDNGKTWTKPVQLLADRGGSPAHLMLHSSGVVISSYGYREAPYGQRMMFSKDEGETWDTDYVLDANGQSGDLGYPATVELKDGSLLTCYYENRDGESKIMMNNWVLPKL